MTNLDIDLSTLSWNQWHFKLPFYSQTINTHNNFTFFGFTRFIKCEVAIFDHYIFCTVVPLLVGISSELITIVSEEFFSIRAAARSGAWSIVQSLSSQSLKGSQSCSPSHLKSFGIQNPLLGHRNLSSLQSSRLSTLPPRMATKNSEGITFQLSICVQIQREIRHYYLPWYCCQSVCMCMCIHPWYFSTLVYNWGNRPQDWGLVTPRMAKPQRYRWPLPRFSHASGSPESPPQKFLIRFLTHSVLSLVLCWNCSKVERQRLWPRTWPGNLRGTSDGPSILFVTSQLDRSAASN